MNPTKQDWRVDPILIYLAILVMFFTGILLWCEFAYKDDGAIYQTFSGVLGALVGALLLRINPKSLNQQESDTKVKEVQALSTISPDVIKDVTK